MKVSDITAQVSQMDGKSSAEIMDHLNSRSITLGAAMTGQGDDLKAVKQMIQTEFKGDARAAVDFLKKHGQDPNIANENVASFVNSGKASQYVQVKLGTNGSTLASAQPAPIMSPPAPPPVPVSSLSPTTHHASAFPSMQSLLAGMIEVGLTAAMTNQKNAGMAPSVLTQALGEGAGVKTVSQLVASVISPSGPKMG